MRSKPISTYVPYGAYELKRSYRKHMLIGHFVAGLLVFLIILMIPPMARIPELLADDEPAWPWPPEPVLYDNSVNWVFAEEDDSGKTEDSTVNVKQIPGPDEFVAYDTPPVLLTAPAPEYPEKALKAGLQGVVWVKVLIDKEGNVRDAIIMKDSGVDAGFEESALESAQKRRNIVPRCKTGSLSRYG